MDKFTRIDGAHAITRTSAGLYSEAELYHLHKHVFIKTGKGYAKLTARHFAEGYTTSQPSLRVVSVHGKGFVEEKFGITYDPVTAKKKAANDRG